MKADRGQVDWGVFFPSGTRVSALPSWQRPRLYLPAQRLMERWEGSSLYPAFRFRARLYRSLLRISAAAGLVGACTVRSGNYWALGEFIQDVLPQARAAAVLVGTPGPPQKITVRLQDQEGRIVGYLKYAEKDVARERIRQEREVLSSVPEGLGPKVLKCGTLGDGVALLMTPISGRHVPATLPPAKGVTDFLMSCAISSPTLIEAHPWVRRLREETQGIEELSACFEALAAKRWSIVVQHGDFAPWILFQKPGGAIGACDWEYGTLEGFPYLDLAYYALRVSALVYRWSPAKAAQYTVKYLTEEPRYALSSLEAWALTRLSAYDAYQRSLEDGQASNSRLQIWQRAVWEGRARRGAFRCFRSARPRELCEVHGPDLVGIHRS